MPNKNTIVGFLKEHNIEYKESGNNQIIIKVCPSCGDNKFHHFYMNADEGLWDCKKCGQSGSFSKFQSFFGVTNMSLNDIPDKVHTPKPQKVFTELNYKIAMDYSARLFSLDTELLDYLKNNRKLEDDVLRQFRIGSTATGLISIPIYEDGNLVNIRYRRNPKQDSEDNPPPKYSQEKNCKTALFNGDILSTDVRQVYVTEGEFDAMQLWQKGITNVVSVTLGAGSFPNEWVEKFKNVETIFLVYDTDEEGKNGMQKAAKKLGEDKCRYIYLPTKDGRKKTDISNYFVDDGHSKDDFIKLSSKSVPANQEADSVKHISEFNDDLRNLLIQGEHIGISTGYKKLDEFMGGLRKGRLVIVAGLTNSGKSSFSVNLGLNLASLGNGIFYFSLEMPPIDIAKKILMLRAKLTSDDLKVVENPSPILDVVDKTLLEFKGDSDSSGLPIYLYKGSGVVKYNVLEKCAKVAKNDFGVQCIIVDHLHYFATNYGNLAAETSQVVRQIKQLAIELDIPIILLAHLNRGGRTKNRKGLYIPSLADLKETSTIEQDADQVLFICRDSESDDPDERRKSFVKIAKNRDGVAGRSVSMSFNEDITCFEEELDSSVDYENDVKEELKELSSEMKVEDLPF